MLLTPNQPSVSSVPSPRPGAAQILPDSDLQVRQAVNALRRGRWLILGCTLIGLLLAGLASLLMHKKYDGVSTIEITKSTSGQPLGLEDLSGIGAELTGGEQMSSDLLTQLSVISSDTTALTVIEELHLENTKPFAIPEKLAPDSPLRAERGVPLEQAPRHLEMALGVFRKNLKVEIVKGTRLMTITYTSADPRLSASIANAVVDASIKQYADARSQASSRASSSLASQVARLKRNVDESQGKVEAFQRTNDVAGLSSALPAVRPGDTSSPSVTFSNAPLERLMELNRDLTNAEVLLNGKEAVHNMASTQDPEVVLGIGSTSFAAAVGPDSAVAPGSADLVLLQQLREQATQVELKLRTYAGKYGAKNPAILELEAEQRSIQGQLKTELAHIEARTANDVQLARQTAAGLRAKVAEQQKAVAKTGTVADQLALLQQQALSDRQLFEDLNTKLAEATVVSGLRSSNISVIDVARVQSEPASPKVSKNLGLGFLGGAVLGTILTFARVFLGNAVYSAGDLAGTTALPVLGVIPAFGKAELSPWVVASPKSPPAEAYRAMRTALLLSGNDNPPRTILFVSASHGEGRTTTCVNTAAAFAVQGHRVLVMNANMRDEDRTEGAGTGTAGLSSYLEGLTPVKALIQRSPDEDNLFFLPAGPAPVNPSELLGGKRFEGLLVDLLEQFDFVFLDSPPALSVTDARVVAQKVEGIVTVVRAGVSSRDRLQRVLAWIPSQTEGRSGICLNGAELEKEA